MNLRANGKFEILELEDLMGKNLNFNFVPIEGGFRLQTASLSSGLYFIKLKSETGYISVERFEVFH